MTSPNPDLSKPLSQDGSHHRAVFFAILVFEIVFLMAARTPIDSDLFWHLAAGEQTLQNGWPILADTFSYTRLGAPWINHSWLGEVVLALAYRAASWIGLSALVALLAAGSMLLVYRQMKGHPIWRAFLIVLASLVAAPVWSARPQIFSLFLLAWVIDTVQRFWQQGENRLFWLPLIFVLWSNLHGGYPLGLLYIGCILAGGLWDWLLHPGAPFDRRMLRLALFGGLGLLAVLVNPNGLNMWRIPFQTVGVSALQQAIPEWASPDFHDLVQQPFLILLAGMVAALGLAGRPAQSGSLIAALLFGVMALVARRNFAPFALASAPVLAAAGWQVIERLLTPPGILARFSRQSDRPGMKRNLQRGLDITIVVVLGLTCLLKLVVAAQPAVLAQYLPATFPVEAAGWLQKNRPAGRLFNEYAWGGYLIWALPEYPVFVDGRTDLFGDEILGEWLQVMAARDGWQDVLSRWQVHLVMVAPGQTLERALQQAGWTLLYQDRVAVIYAR